MAREWETEGRKTTTVCVEPNALSIHRALRDGGDDMGTFITGLMKIFKQITHEDNGAVFLGDGTSI
jgi:hypothetical protein